MRPPSTQDRIYCVPWSRRDKFTNRRYVDKATWREAFDHEGFHSAAVQGSAPRLDGPSPSGGSVPRGLFLPGGKGVDRPIRQGNDRGMKLAENRWLCIRDSVIGPAHNPDMRSLLCAPWAGRAADRAEWRGARGGSRIPTGGSVSARRPVKGSGRGGRAGVDAARLPGADRRAGGRWRSGDPSRGAAVPGWAEGVTDPARPVTRRSRPVPPTSMYGATGIAIRVRLGHAP